MQNQNQDHSRPAAGMRWLALLCGLLPAVALADHTTLTNSDGISYQFDPSESTVQVITFPVPLSGPCGQCNELIVDANGFDGGNSHSTLDGLERTSNVEVLSGLEVSRRTYVSPDNNFVRQVNVFHNPTPADITVSFHYQSNYGANATVVATSSGDAAPDPADHWITTSHTASYALLAQAWGAAGAADTIDAITDPAGASAAQTWNWNNVTVPAGETYIYVTFLAAEADAPAAQAKAEALEAQSLDDMFVGLENNVPQIRNWAFPDTDGDGIFDVTEIANGLDPDDPADAAADADGDGLSNLEELQAGTDITEADTDGDGLEDGAELNTHGTNPLLADSDADGIEDGGELAVGLDPTANDFLTGEEILITDGAQDADQPNFAVDADGNVHLVWSEDDGADSELRYAMLSAAGAVLIAPTPLTNNAVNDRMPDVRVGAGGKVYVAWHDNNKAVSLLRLDPAADDQSGDAANPATLIDVAPVTVSASGHHSHIVADAGGNIHIAWRDRGDSSRRYAKYDPDLANLVADTPLAGDGGQYSDYLGLGLDSAGNVHLCWTTDSDTVVYAMLDGGDGSVLIAPTVVISDGDNPKHASLTVDADDHVNIVWMDRLGEVAEIYFTQLDPAAAAQDGSAANPAAIVTIAEKQISPDNGLESQYPHSTLSADGGILVTWTNEVVNEDETGSRYGPLWLARLDGAGTLIGVPFPLYTDDDGNTNSLLNYFRAEDGYAAWSAASTTSSRQIVLRPLIFTPPGEGPSGTIGVRASAGTLIGAQTLALADLPGTAAADAPAGLTLPDGLARFTVTDLAPGQTIVATLTFPNEVPETAGYFKWDANNGWYEFPFTPGATANEVKLILTDGGTGDADGRANGQIVDPGGYGTVPESGPGPEPGSQLTVEGTGGGGCTLNPNAPFDPMLLLLLTAALVHLWRRRIAG